MTVSNATWSNTQNVASKVEPRDSLLVFFLLLPLYYLSYFLVHFVMMSKYILSFLS